MLLLFMSGCNSSLTDDKGNELARVASEYLYETDVIGLVPENTSTHDSIIIVRSYIDNWVRTRLMIEQAEKNLAIQNLDLDKQLEKYKNSLIIYHYETELIRQKLDTVVAEDEIEQYYYDHLGDFELKENIAKVHYVIVENDDEKETLFEEIYKLPDSLLLDSLESFSNFFAYAHFLDTTAWVKYDELKEIIPIETYNLELFTKGNRRLKFEDEDYIYLLTFVDFKVVDDTSPLDFEKDNILQIIIQKRKMRLIKQLRKDIYEKALQNNEFEIYHD
jgi:hypothetical protein